MSKILFDYQQHIVNNAPKSYALFMDMGTGKTITSLKIAEKWKCKKILVICLKSKIEDWKEEILNETYFDKNHSMVINFESVWRTTKALDFVDENTMVILDESHKCVKNDSMISCKYSKNSIKNICDNKCNRLIKTFNIDTGKTEYKRIESTFNEKKLQNMVKLEITSNYKDTILECTPDHEILTKNRGFVSAAELNELDEIILDFDSRTCAICKREFFEDDTRYINKTLNKSYKNICSDECSKIHNKKLSDKIKGDKNPIYNKNTREKMKRSLKNNGKQFKGINAKYRGGNGKLSPAENLAQDFMYSLGFENRTGVHIPKHIQQKYHTPWVYKPDYIHKNKKIAIEFDGNTHSGRDDEKLGIDKKTVVLKQLGYITYRFANEYILENFEDFKEDVCKLLEN